MGNCLASADTKRTKAIDRNLRNDFHKARNKVKILLLGAGESGKSTLFKQMKLLYSKTKTFSESERNDYKKIISGNIYFDTRLMISSTDSHSPLESVEGQEAAREVMKWKKEHVVQGSDVSTLTSLWEDPGMQKTWRDRGNIQVQDAWEYYMRNIARIGSPGWIPNDQDILRSRVRTSGVVSATFYISQTNFEMYDVGGQRNERRKWMHHFGGVTTVLFVAAISEYNQLLYEDQNVSRQEEAIELFQKVLEYETFMETPFILFLNKCDLFREKLGKVPFSVIEGENQRNVDFEGPHCDLSKRYNYEEVGADSEFEACYESAVRYLARLYEAKAPAQRGVDKKIYAHPTNSTDSDNIEKIMVSCREIILNDNLLDQGWL